MDPGVRSKLRARVPSAQKKEELVVTQPPKCRGRPDKGKGSTKVKAEVTQPMKERGRKATNASVTKPPAPRQKRGFTTIDVPEKFVAQVRQYLEDLQHVDLPPTPVEDAEEGIEIEIDTDAQAEAGAEAQDFDTVIEEGVQVTSATAVDRDDDMLTKQIDEKDIADVGYRAPDEDVKDYIHEDSEHVNEDLEVEDPTGHVEVEMSVQEVVQMEVQQQDIDDENVKSQYEPDSLIDDDFTTSPREHDSRPSAGSISS